MLCFVLIAFFWTFYVFGYCFRMLVVILVSDFFNDITDYHSVLQVCRWQHCAYLSIFMISILWSLPQSNAVKDWTLVNEPQFNENKNRSPPLRSLTVCRSSCFITNWSDLCWLSWFCLLSRCHLWQEPTSERTDEQGLLNCTSLN